MADYPFSSAKGRLRLPARLPQSAKHGSLVYASIQATFYVQKNALFPLWLYRHRLEKERCHSLIS